MGVKNLWPELSEVSKRNVPVSSLEGKTVAIDLGSWIVELRTVNTSHNYKNLYLRNVYYRVTDLMRKGVKVIVVADGKAPEIKQSAMKKRSYHQFGTNSTDTDRKGFKLFSEKCEELLSLLGIPFLYSPGEGEALCAALSKVGFVDGVITNDADAFLYGARTVYTNYSKDNGFTEYCMDDIENELKITRRGMIFIALLAGCDLDLAGVEGVGPKKGIALVQEYTKLGIDPLDRLYEWKTNIELIELEKAEKTAHCSACNHTGKKIIHKDEGCNICGTMLGCSSNGDKPCPCIWHKRQSHNLELKVRKRALEDPGFPNKKLIDEYLNSDKLTKDIDLSSLSPKAVKLPQLRAFIRGNFKKLDEDFWKSFSPVLADMQLRRMTSSVPEEFTLKPIRIVKYCKRAGQDCVEVEWKKLAEDLETKEDSYTFTVNSEKFKEAYPQMAEQFTPSKGQKRKCETVTQEARRGQQNLMSFFKVIKN